MKYITRQEEVLLSYLIGLAPIGQEFFLKEEQTLADLYDICTDDRTRLAALTTGLVVAGAIDKPYRSHYIVLKPLEAFTVYTEGFNNAFTLRHPNITLGTPRSVC